jgi:hypothetical protein
VTRSATSLSSDFVYTANIKGQISRISKHDICRNQIRLKEKLKNKQVHKVSGVDDDDPTLQNEAYLYAENDVAITQLAVLKSHSSDVLAYSMRDRNYIKFE